MPVCDLVRYILCNLLRIVLKIYSKYRECSFVYDDETRIVKVMCKLKYQQNTVIIKPRIQLITIISQNDSSFFHINPQFPPRPNVQGRLASSASTAPDMVLPSVRW